MNGQAGLGDLPPVAPPPSPIDAHASAAGVRVPAEAGPANHRPEANVPFVSPLRSEATHTGSVAATATAELPPIAPADPLPTYHEPPDLELLATEQDDEPALPDEARSRAVQASEAPTAQVESQPDQILHVRFGGASSDR